MKVCLNLQRNIIFITNYHRLQSFGITSIINILRWAFLNARCTDQSHRSIVLVHCNSPLYWLIVLVFRLGPSYWSFVFYPFRWAYGPINFFLLLAQSSLMPLDFTNMPFATSLTIFFQPFPPFYLQIFE